jgi:hypothetical protein
MKSMVRALIKGSRWEILTAFGLANRKVNRRIEPISSTQLGLIGCPVREVSLTNTAYNAFLSTEALYSYQRLPYIHTKPLEYFVSASILDPLPGMRLLDAAGGGHAQYCRVVQSHFPGVETWSQDSLLVGMEREGVRYVGGSVDSIALESGTVDRISCHHSIEHFRGDIDMAFIRELCRLLAPDGVACIVPLFLTNVHAHIWNGVNDPLDLASAGRQRQIGGEPEIIRDRTAAFCGWGPFEGFARTYDAEAFNARLLASLCDKCEAEVVKITIDNHPVPSLRHNHHQPKCNGELKVLIIRKRGDSGSADMNRLGSKTE